MQTIEIFPAPRMLRFDGGTLPLPVGLEVTADDVITREFQRRQVRWQDILPAAGSNGACLPLTAVQDDELSPEGYHLSIQPAGVVIRAGDAAGAYYAVGTLRQVFEQAAAAAGGGRLPCLTVEDAPALSLRGVLLDVGRNKIPNISSLKLLIDRFADMKFNHLQLYMDGYCFSWQAYAYLFSDETPVTAEELRELVAYAAARFIDLAPNLNSLGHMEHWLARPQFRRFAECENGFDFQGLYHRAPGTIDPQNPDAVAWVQSLFDELLENFESDWVNVNLDEPFELGKGKNAALAAQQGAHAPYLLQVRNMYRYCAGRGKRMMMWGDVLMDSPVCIPELPRDITVLHWMYEGDGRFEPAARALAQSGLDFVLCPGTSAWCSFTGRSDRMRRNIADAVDCAVRFGARGVLLTDWGDLGHWQYISASLVPFALAAGMCWSGLSQPEAEVFAYCDRALFGDTTGRAARLFYALGNYYQYEHAPLFSTTLCCGVMTSKHRFNNREEFSDAVELLRKLSGNLARGMNIAIEDPDIRLDADGLRAYMQNLLAQVRSLELKAPDGALTKREMELAGRFVLHGLTLYETMTGPLSGEAFADAVGGLYTDLDGLLQNHYHLWTARNRTGGFAASSAQFLHLLRVYDRCRKTPNEI